VLYYKFHCDNAFHAPSAVTWSYLLDSQNSPSLTAFKLALNPSCLPRQQILDTTAFSPSGDCQHLRFDFSNHAHISLCSLNIINLSLLLNAVRFSLRTKARSQNHSIKQKKCTSYCSTKPNCKLDPFAVISLEAVAYSSYCNTVEWFWWDWSLSQWPNGFLRCFDAVGRVIWPVKIVPEMTYKASSGTLSLYTCTPFFTKSICKTPHVTWGKCQ